MAGLNKQTGAIDFDGGTPLQIGRWSGQRASLVASGTSGRITLPTGAEYIEITAVEPTYLNFGDVTVVATTVIASDGSRYFAAGVQVISVPLDPATSLPYTHVAILQVSLGGLIQVEQLV